MHNLLSKKVFKRAYSHFAKGDCRLQVAVEADEESVIIMQSLAN